MAPTPTPYPLDPAAVTGTDITMDQYLRAPTVMTRRVAEIAAQEFFAHNLFSNGGGVTGGTILFERPNPLLTDLYAARRTQEMAPGTQAPILTFSRGVPMIAVPREIGGKFATTKQERLRNDPRIVERHLVQIGNTIARDLEVMALSEIAAVVAATGRTFAAANTLAAASAQSFNTRTPANQHAADIARMQATVHNEQRGHRLNAAIYNTLDWALLVAIYAANGGDGNAGARAMLAANGISSVDVSVQHPQGQATFYEAGQIGTWYTEFALAHVMWIDHVEDEKQWDQWTISPAFAIDDQFAMIRMTGI